MLKGIGLKKLQRSSAKTSIRLHRKGCSRYW